MRRKNKRRDSSP